MSTTENNVYYVDLNSNLDLKLKPEYRNYIT